MKNIAYTRTKKYNSYKFCFNIGYEETIHANVFNTRIRALWRVLETSATSLCDNVRQTNIRLHRRVQVDS